MDTSHNPYTSEEVRLVLFISRQRVLVQTGPGDSRELPRMQITSGRRPAEEITNYVRANWGLQCIVIDFLHLQDVAAPCVIVETLGSAHLTSHRGLRVVSVDSIGRSQLSDEELCVIAAIVRGNTSERGPFSRLGWIDDVKLWIQHSVPHKTIRFDGNVQQLNAGGSFALARLGTIAAPAYWVKATGDINRHEFQVTTTLARIAPDSLPPIVAVRDDWNAWVSEEAGTPLTQCPSLSMCELAVNTLAQLQLASIDNIGSLKTAGCADQSIVVLLQRSPELIDYLKSAMSVQTSTKARRLDNSRIDRIEETLRSACSRMLDLHVPDALVHNDLNPGNILVTSSHCVITDWAEAVIGNPFAAFQNLCVHLAKHDSNAASWISRLQAVYRGLWRNVLPERDIDTALELAPLLAIASYLYGRGNWLGSPSSQRPEFQSYVRSLTRQMDRAVDALNMNAIHHL